MDITEIQNQPGNSNVRTVIRSGRITVRIHDELQSAVTCELQSVLRGAARRPAWPGTESPAVPAWDLLGPPALPSATPTVSAVQACPRRSPGGVRVVRASFKLAPTARLVRPLRSAATAGSAPGWHCAAAAGRAGNLKAGGLGSGHRPSQPPGRRRRPPSGTPGGRPGPARHRDAPRLAQPVRVAVPAGGGPLRLAPWGIALGSLRLRRSRPRNLATGTHAATCTGASSVPEPSLAMILRHSDSESG
jgi:hypothetical protein